MSAINRLSRQPRSPVHGAGGFDARGFTLIELLVVIAIITLLIAILLPSLSAARKQGQAVKCAANLHDIGTAMASYLADWDGVYPPAYIYPADQQATYDFFDQNPTHPFGYLHWSWFLYSKGQVGDKAFQCPGYFNGGAPRTNPGSSGSDWESGQVDQNGTSSSNDTLADAQAPRMAYTGNAAIFPRNKFTQDLSAAEGGGLRTNVFTLQTKVGDTAKTILLTEFLNNWQAIAVQSSGGLLSKSHRSINPFYHVGAGTNEYSAPVDTPGFTYGDAPHYGVLPKQQAEEAVCVMDNPGVPEINAVGRHHPGGDAYSGGAANFAYADGHVEKRGVLQTMENREWGQYYYAINGANKVGPPW
ncbi:MAG: prepilin-type N-terminal cleavage/methylation domain-containing protein [Phycisphaerae bacterium]